MREGLGDRIADVEPQLVCRFAAVVTIVVLLCGGVAAAAGWVEGPVGAIDWVLGATRWAAVLGIVLVLVARRRWASRFERELRSAGERDRQ